MAAAGLAGCDADHPSVLEHWTSPERARRLFFCQVEALETAIYFAEGARNLGGRLD